MQIAMESLSARTSEPKARNFTVRSSRVDLRLPTERIFCLGSMAGPFGLRCHRATPARVWRARPRRPTRRRRIKRVRLHDDADYALGPTTWSRPKIDAARAALLRRQ